MGHGAGEVAENDAFIPASDGIDSGEGVLQHGFGGDVAVDIDFAFAEEFFHLVLETRGGSDAIFAEFQGFAHTSYAVVVDSTVFFVHGLDNVELGSVLQIKDEIVDVVENGFVVFFRKLFEIRPRPLQAVSVLFLFHISLVSFPEHQRASFLLLLSNKPDTLTHPAHGSTGIKYIKGGL